MNDKDTNTDEQLKTVLAKMLPNDIKLTETKDEANNYYCYLSWKGSLNPHDMEVRDTELLHLCWMVEETLTPDEWNEFKNTFENILSWSIFPINFMHASWQQRVVALAKVKGILEQGNVPCVSCGTPWNEHKGIMSLCAEHTELKRLYSELALECAAAKDQNVAYRLKIQKYNKFRESSDDHAPAAPPLMAIALEQT